MRNLTTITLGLAAGMLGAAVFSAIESAFAGGGDLRHPDYVHRTLQVTEGLVIGDLSDDGRGYILLTVGSDGRPQIRMSDRMDGTVRSAVLTGGRLSLYATGDELILDSGAAHRNAAVRFVPAKGSKTYAARFKREK